jgi:hypothetical protein
LIFYYKGPLLLLEDHDTEHLPSLGFEKDPSLWSLRHRIDTEPTIRTLVNRLYNFQFAVLGPILFVSLLLASFSEVKIFVALGVVLGMVVGLVVGLVVSVVVGVANGVASGTTGGAVLSTTFGIAANTMFEVL